MPPRRSRPRSGTRSPAGLRVGGTRGIRQCGHRRVDSVARRWFPTYVYLLSPLRIPLQSALKLQPECWSWYCLMGIGRHSRELRDALRRGEGARLEAGWGSSTACSTASPARSARSSASARRRRTTHSTCRRSSASSMSWRRSIIQGSSASSTTESTRRARTTRWSSCRGTTCATRPPCRTAKRASSCATSRRRCRSCTRADCSTAI